MIARTKVVPPVTPRIVQARPRLRLFLLTLLVCTVVLAAWIGYDFGRRQAAAPDGAAPLAWSGTAEPRIGALERERDALLIRIAELEHRLAELSQSLEATPVQLESVPQTPPSPREVPVQKPAPEPEPEPEPEPAPAPAPAPEPEPAAPVTKPADNQLKVENVRIVEAESEDVFRIGFSVMHAGDSAERVTGTIWIAVNGFVNGEPRRLSFKTLSPDQRSFVKMGFELQQDVMEDVVLPEDFQPRNILIEAKPYGATYSSASQTFAWNP